MDAFVLFYLSSLAVTANRKFVGVITPDTWLTLLSTQPLRKYLFEHSRLKEVVDMYKPFPESKDTRCHIVILEKMENQQTTYSFDIKMVRPTYELEDIAYKKFYKFSKLTSSFLAENIEKGWHIYQSEKEFKFRSSMMRNSLILNLVAIVKYGLRTGENEKFVSENKILSIDIPLTAGHDLERYTFDWKPKYLKTTSDLPISYFGDEQKYPKIAIQYVRTNSTLPTARWLECTYLCSGFVCLNSLSFIFNPHKNYSLMFLLSLLNSFAMNRYYRLLYTDVNVKPAYLSTLPIRRMAFVTPEKEREKLATHAKERYRKGLEAFPDVLVFVEERLAKKHKPAPELIRKHNADPLNKDWQIPDGTPWEQSDIVHDILAFLAEQMIEMNKEKQTEIKGFLEWLERQCKARIDELKNKTRIKNYHKHSFEEFLDTLKNNVHNLQVNIDREFEERLKTEFEKSIAKLDPLKEKIEKTDWLIDQIVYKLYGLTEEEIKVVENK